MCPWKTSYLHTHVCPAWAWMIQCWLVVHCWNKDICLPQAKINCEWNPEMLMFFLSHFQGLCDVGCQKIAGRKKHLFTPISVEILTFFLSHFQGSRSVLGHPEPFATLSDHHPVGEQLCVGVQQGQPQPPVQHVRLWVPRPAQVPHHARGVHAQGRSVESAEWGTYPSCGSLLRPETATYQLCGSLLHPETAVWEEDRGESPGKERGGVGREMVIFVCVKLEKNTAFYPKQCDSIKSWGEGGGMFYWLCLVTWTKSCHEFLIFFSCTECLKLMCFCVAQVIFLYIVISMNS